jgi:outer membrane protein assembly factor BamA
VFIDDGNSIRRITPRTHYVASPIFDPQGGLFFVADYDSAFNLYWHSGDSATVVKKTNILTGIYYPSIARDGSKIAFTHYQDYGYDVCVVKDPVSKMENADVLQEHISDTPYYEAAFDKERVEKYRTTFTVDYFTASASYYSSLGFAGLAQLGFSDILGNHHFVIATDLYGSLTSSDIFLNYWYIKKRIDYGGLLYHYFSYYRDANDLIEWRYLGLAAFMQYPFDRFFRVELGWYAYRLYESRFLNYFVIPPWETLRRRTASFNIFYPSLAFVYDNVKWGDIGPHSGCRSRLSAYSTVFSGRDVRSAILDHRRYFHLSPRANLAARLVLAASIGDDAEIWSIGGPYSLRGYDYYDFSGSKIGFLNLEYRFPFIDRLKISFPLPLEIRNVRGVLFSDFGGVYTDSFTVYTTDDGFQLQDLKMGLGAGVRFSMFYIVFNFEWARAHDFKQWLDGWKFYFTIGPEW